MFYSHRALKTFRVFTSYDINLKCEEVVEDSFWSLWCRYETIQINCLKLVWVGALPLLHSHHVQGDRGSEWIGGEERKYWRQGKARSWQWRDQRNRL